MEFYIYTFVDENGYEHSDFLPFITDYNEAVKYAEPRNFAVIQHVYRWSDEEMVADFRRSQLNEDLCPFCGETKADCALHWEASR